MPNYILAGLVNAFFCVQKENENCKCRQSCENAFWMPLPFGKFLHNNLRSKGVRFCGGFRFWTCSTNTLPASSFVGQVKSGKVHKVFKRNVYRQEKNSRLTCILIWPLRQSWGAAWMKWGWVVKGVCWGSDRRWRRSRRPPGRPRGPWGDPAGSWWAPATSSPLPDTRNLSSRSGH